MEVGVKNKIESQHHRMGTQVNLICGKWRNNITFTLEPMDSGWNPQWRVMKQVCSQWKSSICDHPGSPGTWFFAERPCHIMGWECQKLQTLINTSLSSPLITCLHRSAHRWPLPNQLTLRTTNTAWSFPLGSSLGLSFNQAYVLLYGISKRNFTLPHLEPSNQDEENLCRED